MNARRLKSAINLLREADGATVDQMINDMDSLGEFDKARRRAVPHAPSARFIEDESHDPHGEGPIRSDSEVGPSQSASGDGADRMVAEYSPDAQNQGTPSYALGAALNSLRRGMDDLEKALRRLTKASSEEDDTNDESEDDGEPRDGEKAAEKRAKTGADKGRRPPAFRGNLDAALAGTDTLETDIRSFFGAVMGAGDVAKSNIVIAKAQAGIDTLDGMDGLAAQRLLSHASAAAKGVFPASTFAKELANADGRIVRALLGAIRS